MARLWWFTILDLLWPVSVDHVVAHPILWRGWASHSTGLGIFFLLFLSSLRILQTNLSTGLGISFLLSSPSLCVLTTKLTERAWVSLSCSIHLLSRSSRGYWWAAVFRSCSWCLLIRSGQVLWRVSTSRARLVSWVVSKSRCCSSCCSSLLHFPSLCLRCNMRRRYTLKPGHFQNLRGWHTSLSTAMEVWLQPTQLKKHTKSLGKKCNLGDSIRCTQSACVTNWTTQPRFVSFGFTAVFRALLWKNNSRTTVEK